MSEFQLTAYNVKTKEKNVPIHDAVVTKQPKELIWYKAMMGKEIS